MPWLQHVANPICTIYMHGACRALFSEHANSWLPAAVSICLGLHLRKTYICMHQLILLTVGVGLQPVLELI